LSRRRRPGAGAGHLVDVAPGDGGDAREPLQEVEGGPLAGQEGGHGRLDLRDYVTREHGRAVGDQAAEGGGRIDQLE
jgi:hypothetical protein